MTYNQYKSMSLVIKPRKSRLEVEYCILPTSYIAYETSDKLAYYTLPLQFDWFSFHKTNYLGL